MQEKFNIDDASAHGSQCYRHYSREKIAEGANSLKPSLSHALLDSVNSPTSELEPPTQATYSSTIEVRYQRPPQQQQRSPCITYLLFAPPAT